MKNKIKYNKTLLDFLISRDNATFISHYRKDSEILPTHISKQLNHNIYKLQIKFRNKKLYYADKNIEVLKIHKEEFIKNIRLDHEKNIISI